MASKKITAKVTPKGGGGKIGTLKSSEARKAGKQGRKIGKKVAKQSIKTGKQLARKSKRAVKKLAKNLPKTAKRLQYEGRIKRAIKEYEKLGYSLSDEQRKSLLNKRPKTADKAREAVRKSIRDEYVSEREITGKWIKKHIFGGKLTDEEYYMMRDTGLINLDGHWKEGTGIPYNEFFEWAKTQDNSELTSILPSIRYKVGKELSKKVPSIKKGK